MEETVGWKCHRKLASALLQQREPYRIGMVQIVFEVLRNLFSASIRIFHQIYVSFCACTLLSRFSSSSPPPSSTTLIMQRALSSAVRSSLGSSSPYSRTSGRSLQQLRFAHKELKFGVEGRAQLLKGVETLSKAVSTTLGPKGRNVLIESSYGSPKITKGTLSP